MENSPLSYEQAQSLVERGQRVGWIVPEGYVCVDVDNEDCEESSDCVERVLNSLEVHYAYNRTSRGVHFILEMMQCLFHLIA